MANAISNYLQEAFDEVCKEAKEPQGAYVSLIETVPYYGGPEEGGWWGSDSIVVGYQWFDTMEAAEAAKEQVEKLAEKMSADSKRAFGEQCLRECEWCDERGLDYDYLREPDGESSFYVEVSDGIPSNRYGTRRYE